MALTRGSLMQSESIYILLACLYKQCTSHGPSRMSSTEIHAKKAHNDMGRIKGTKKRGQNTQK